MRATSACTRGALTDDPATSRAKRKCFEAQVLTDQIFALMRVVALIEHQIKDVEDRVEPTVEFGSAGQIE